MDDRARIATALLAMGVAVFIVMFMWTLDKFLNVPHAAREIRRTVQAFGRTVDGSQDELATGYQSGTPGRKTCIERLRGNGM